MCTYVFESKNKKHMKNELKTTFSERNNNVNHLSLWIHFSLVAEFSIIQMRSYWIFYSNWTRTNTEHDTCMYSSCSFCLCIRADEKERENNFDSIFLIKIKP